MIRAVDRFLFRTKTRGWSPEHVMLYTDHFAVDGEGSLGPDPIGRSFQVIDNKAGGPLTHTSMMIAALGVSAPVVVDNHFEQGVIVPEIVLYLLVALGCLCALSMFQRESERRSSAPRLKSSSSAANGSNCAITAPSC
jgi:hypothetical protein